MVKKKSFILIVATRAGASLKRVTVSYKLFYLICLLCILTAIGVIFAAFQYAKVTLMATEFDNLLKENKQIKFENQTYKLLTDQVGEKISSLEIVCKKLSIISGLEPLRAQQGGIGGLSNTFVSAPSQRGQSIDQLTNMANQIPSLEVKFNKLNEVFKEQSLLNIYTPSIWPVKGYISRGFGYQASPLNEKGDHHAGLDISAPYGNKIIAPASGIVTFAGYHRDYGNLVIVNHKLGVTTLYGHLSRIHVKIGQKVERHNVIGLVGSTGRSTGPHLHYEVRVNNRLVNPYRFIKEDRGSG